MCSEFWFYVKLPRSILSNLGFRLSNEMADLGVSVKQKMFKTISFRFPSSRRQTELQSISEDPELPDNTSQCVRQRPLPSLPENEVMSMPWFKRVDRKKAEYLVASGKDGCFLVRPSSKGEHSFALTLWFNKRPYNIPIRRRSDNKYALGTPKDLEQNFSSIQELIENYYNEELELYSKGEGTGRLKLSKTKITKPGAESSLLQ